MDTKTRKKYNAWKKYLTILGKPTSEELFISIYDSIDTSYGNFTNRRFYTGRYHDLISEQEIDYLVNEAKQSVNLKRGSIYDVTNVMNKKNLSEGDARKYVDNLKQQTCGSLSNYIKRYGEVVGRNKYDEFKQKCSINLNTLISKHGVTEGNKKWDNYKNSRDSASLEFYIEKYGEVEGRQLFVERNTEFAKHHTQEGLVELYGEEGRERYKKLGNSKRVTIESMIAKYGEKEGTLRFVIVNKKKGESCFKNLIKEFGEVKGKEVYNELNIKKSPVYHSYLKLFDGNQDLAIEQYQRVKAGIIENPTSESLRTRFTKASKGPVSKSSKRFFIELELGLGRSLLYGAKGKEKTLFSVEDGSIYHYDCYDEVSNTLIEFQGEAFHPKLNETDWVGPYGNTYEKAINHDLNKENLALMNGYRYLVVWNKEVFGKANRISKIEEMKTVLNENT